MSHLIFDFDGVIADTYAMNWKIVHELFPEVPEEAYRIDHHRGNVFADSVVPFTPTTVEAYYVLYRERLSVAHLASALPTLQTLAANFQFHIVSSNCELAITRALSEAGIITHFKHILGQQAHQSKVEKFKMIAHHEQIDLKDALFVTDTIGDIKEANQVELPTIAVTFGYHPKELLAEYDVPLAHSWEEVQQIVEAMYR